MIPKLSAAAVCVMGVFGAAWSGHGAADNPPIQAWNFEQSETGKAPPGWSIRETHPSGKIGAWIVVSDAGAPSKSNVLRLVTQADEDTYNVALVEKTEFKDLDLRVRLRADGGTADQGGGLVWRCKDENNYYICRVNPLESNFRVYKVVGGKRTQLASAKVEAEKEKWYQVRAVMVGGAIQCYLDDKLLLDARDDAFNEAGMIGLWTKADASTTFDDLEVRISDADKRPASIPGTTG